MAVPHRASRLSWLLGHHSCTTCALLRGPGLPLPALVRPPVRALASGSSMRHPCDEKKARLWAANLVTELEARDRQFLREAMQSYEVEHGGDEVSKLTKLQIRQVLFYNAIPFVGFGFLDNAIMIVAGEYIDFTFGTLFSISTMAAAALGNLVSDVCGVGLAGYVELIATRFGVATPNITAAQYEMKEARWSSALGRAIGVSFGCLIGMFPLLFFAEEEEAEETPAEAAKPDPVRSEVAPAPSKST